MLFHDLTYMATPLQKNSCPGIHKIYNNGRPFLAIGHHVTIYLLCPFYALD